MLSTSKLRRRWLGTAATLALVGLASGGLAGCDFMNPTEVENPRTTEEDLAEAEAPTAALLPGLRAQFARALRATVVVTENVSDNYSIHGTGLAKELDEPRLLVPSLTHINGTGDTGIYFNLQELRALADFVLEDIAPEDATATAAQIAEARFYRGMAFLMQAENFVAVPVQEDGEPVAAADILTDYAIPDLKAVIDTAPDGEFATAAHAALARAYRLAGNGGEAVTHATAALDADPAFVYAREFDAASIQNSAFWYLYTRALQEMQPLPRLDFLDPKFTSREAAIPFAKAEEMHLILAEASMADGQWGAAREHIAQAIEVADGRPVQTEFIDDDARNNSDLTLRPRSAEIKVRADSASPFRSGLVLSRPGAVDVPTISGTSLDADSIRGIAASDQEALLHALYLARQEILFLEGRRMSDLGIRLPMMQREIDANPNIAEGDPGTEVLVPDYIPARDRMDLFTPHTPYDGTGEDATLVTDEVTILVDMNRILAENRVSPFNIQ